MREINYIVIHEAACPRYKPSGDPFTIRDIDKWHIDRGFKRSSQWINKWHPELKACGYTYVIEVDGAIKEGRHEDEVCSAVKGFNAVSISICLIGQNGDFTDQQWMALQFLVTQLHDKYPGATITGHYDERFNSGKTCPGFDVQAWCKERGVTDVTA